jgi:hypothetical protein
MPDDSLFAGIHAGDDVAAPGEVFERAVIKDIVFGSTRGSVFD